ncbi:hypothetical protein O181_082621 [Austropuccinia psidii MF-1]|uniref:Uncharacterized protein n=1 Tax=Austropuccinia psidii MF-1 TaxID=1389203 RepID=A0A9Q3IH46_9BASI|nr:hypothetical protein [Austropuccinia psidii MF-1]
MTTISHLLQPLVDDLIKLKGPMKIPTFKEPNGQIIPLLLLTIVGDSGTTHKVGGFASHSEKYFYTWCLAKDTNIANIQCGPGFEGQRTQEKGFQWKNARNRQKIVLLRESGVQYSELN